MAQLHKSIHGEGTPAESLAEELVEGHAEE